ncbi:uncharacterized protein LOC115891386 [Sitophilus oryzae]|uniref:Uncharacterized protein LOC115891386 n=1 Tax=Sitophilus oryzae TaxID=7048 RepID=A0A6J2YU97_SITOR|nr:uncharacterized protein LOC115891386 [Sitophilus oryzae]
MKFILVNLLIIIPLIVYSQDSQNESSEQSNLEESNEEADIPTIATETTNTNLNTDNEEQEKEPTTPESMSETTINDLTTVENIETTTEFETTTSTYPCGENEQYDCLPLCIRTCHNVLSKIVCAPAPMRIGPWCKEGCHCKDGFIKDKTDGKCVRECPFRKPSTVEVNVSVKVG